jgi:haloacetate dehalogenase
MPLFREPRAVSVVGYGGLRLNVWDYGGAGTPLLLCHCTGTLGRVWDVVVAELADQFRVLAPDTRGQGDSEAPALREDYRWDFSGRDIHAVLQHFGLPKGVAAAGHSAGGAHVAYAEYLEPGTFAQVMLMDAVIADRRFFEGENKLAVKVRRRKNEFPSLHDARERLTSKPPMGQWVPGAVDAYLAHAFVVAGDGSCRLKCPGDREAWFYELGGASDVFNALEQLSFSALLVTGEHSYAIPWVEAQHAKFAGSRVETVAGAGHFIPQEKPAETAALIRSWFG